MANRSTAGDDQREAMRQELKRLIDAHGIDVDRLALESGLADSIGLKSFLKGNLGRVGVGRVERMLEMLRMLGPAPEEAAPKSEEAPRQPEAVQAPTPAKDQVAEKPARTRRTRERVAPPADDRREQPAQVAETPTPEAAADAAVAAEPADEAPAVAAEPAKPGAWADAFELGEQDWAEAAAAGKAAPRPTIGSGIRVLSTAYWASPDGIVHAVDYLDPSDVAKRSSVIVSDERTAAPGEEVRELRVTADGKYVVRLVDKDGADECNHVGADRAKELFTLTCKDEEWRQAVGFEKHVRHTLETGRVLRKK